MEQMLTLKNQLCFAIYETSSEFNKLYANLLQPYGLTYPQYLALLALWEQDGLSMKELGERLTLGTGTLTPMINRMEAGGWLRKERSSEDERRVHVFLLQKARDLKGPIVQKVTEEIIGCQIELEEYEQLMQRLHRIQAKLRSRNK